MPRGAGTPTDRAYARASGGGPVEERAKHAIAIDKEYQRTKKDTAFEAKRRAKEVMDNSAKLKSKTSGQKLGDWAGRRLETAKKNVRGVKAALGSDSAAAAIKEANKGLAGAVKESGRRKSTNVRDKRGMGFDDKVWEQIHIERDYEDPEQGARPKRHSSPANKYAVKRSPRPDTMLGSGAVNVRPKVRPGPADPGYKKPPRGKIDWTPPRPKKRPKKASS